MSCLWWLAPMRAVAVAPGASCTVSMDAATDWLWSSCPVGLRMLARSPILETPERENFRSFRLGLAPLKSGLLSIREKLAFSRDCCGFVCFKNPA